MKVIVKKYNGLGSEKIVSEFPTKKAFISAVLDGADVSDVEGKYPDNEFAQAVELYINRDGNFTITCGKNSYGYKNGKYYSFPNGSSASDVSKREELR